MNAPLNLVILGPQGSGKGTQAKLLAEKFGYLVLGTGDILREIARQNSELGRRVHQIINVEGRLVEPELASRVIFEKIHSIPKEQPVLLDSFPRSLEQYQLMKEWWSTLARGKWVVIFLELSEEEAVKRLSLRARVDDKPEAVRQRLALYNSETLPMITEMEKDGRVLRIDGAPSIEEVQVEIVKKLGL